jgi:hypothetical protein
MEGTGGCAAQCATAHRPPPPPEGFKPPPTAPSHRTLKPRPPADASHGPFSRTSPPTSPSPAQSAHMIEDAEQSGRREVPLYTKAKSPALDQEYLRKVGGRGPARGAANDQAAARALRALRARGLRGPAPAFWRPSGRCRPMGLPAT